MGAVNTPSVNDPFCHDCTYRGIVCENLYCCNYLLRTGKIRPCSPGAGCTVKVPIKVKRRKKKMNNPKGNKSNG